MVSFGCRDEENKASRKLTKVHGSEEMKECEVKLHKSEQKVYRGKE
jgi:hypothetical protein